MENLTFTDGKTRLKELIKRNFASKPVEFYLKSMGALPDNWQQVIKDKGDYIIENIIVLYFLKKKIDKKKI